MGVLVGNSTYLKFQPPSGLLSSSCGGLKGPTDPQLILAAEQTSEQTDERTDNGFKVVRYLSFFIPILILTIAILINILIIFKLDSTSPGVTELQVHGWVNGLW